MNKFSKCNILILNLGLKLLKIRYESYWDYRGGCLMSDASALYGFNKELMPDLEIIIRFGPMITMDTKKG